MRPRIFVGSSREAISVCRAVQLELADDFDVTVWNQDVFQLSYGALDSLLVALDSSDAGVFVLQSDDLTISRNTKDWTTRDNVIFELGMFMGRLGRDRTFMLAPHASGIRLPSDLLGITTASYDGARITGTQKRAAVGPACTKIRDHLERLRLRVTAEPNSRARLDRAMGRMSRDLESLLAPHSARATSELRAGADKTIARASIRIGRATVHIEPGQIQEFADKHTVIGLPANEYFDDECITDTKSSLGAFVNHHFGDRIGDFLCEIETATAGLPSQRVPRAERRVDDSYGIGQALYLRGLAPDHHIIVVSATTERVGIGLRAEPHFLYAAIQGIIETMNEHRLSSLTIPVLGSGHGGMPLTVALLFNLLALRSVLLEDTGRKIREVRIVVLDRAAAEVADEALRDIVAQVTHQQTGG
jgi:O-acetyl-ADP-ribose deacetylase (regulator of RNase III)